MLIVALSAASLTRVRVLPALACLITYLAALLIYLNAALAAGRSVAGFVPTTGLGSLLVVAGQQRPE